MANAEGVQPEQRIPETPAVEWSGYGSTKSFLRFNNRPEVK
jgi:hypothetical protein